ncbi:MAG: hypothetical protein ACEQSB_03640 [Undibacterium sp.]
MLRIVGFCIIALLLLTGIIGGLYFARVSHLKTPPPLPEPMVITPEREPSTSPTPEDEEKNEEKEDAVLPPPVETRPETISASVAPAAQDWFNQNGTFDEVGDMKESKMEDWWLNSGAYLSIKDGIAQTVQGELEKNDKRRIYYKGYNASETDDGYHPQNIFRLVTKTQWKNFRQECFFKLNRYILSEDEHRSESNGLLLFNRYQDENNLYYTGIRVDGTVVVKKKINGEYFTLDQKAVLPGTYDRKKNPNLLPVGKWIGVRSDVTTRADTAAIIKVYLDLAGDGKWELALTVTDTGKKYGGPVIEEAGYAGIRTDFMDVEFRDYRIDELPADPKKQ